MELIVEKGFIEIGNLNLNRNNEEIEKKPKVVFSKDDLDKSKDNANSSLNRTIQSKKSSYVFPYLDHLFKFLDEKEDLNYVLSGYFYKIFSHIINIKGTHLITYLYIEKPHIFDKFIYHIKRKSICDCLCKILTIHLDEPDPYAVKLKIDTIKKILLQLEYLDMEALANVADMILECMKNKQFYASFISEISIFELFNNWLSLEFKNDILMKCESQDNCNCVDNFNLNEINNADKLGDKNEIFKNLLRIMNKLNEMILKEFSTELVTPCQIDDTEAILFNFQSMDIDVVKTLKDDEVLSHKIDTTEVQIKLDKIFDILCEISYKIIETFINCDKEIITLNTTYEVNSRIFGTKR